MSSTRLATLARDRTPPGDPHEARLEALVRDYGRLIRQAIRSVGGVEAAADADDIEQIVVAALWQQIRREQVIDHPASYVYKAAVRETVKAVGRWQRHRDALEEYSRRHTPALAAPSPEAGVLAGERRRRLHRALALLAKDRARAVRAHLQGFSAPEIMTLFGWDYQKTRNLVARGMADLRRALEERGTT